MNKLELIRKLAEQIGITNAEPRKVVNLFFDSIANALSNGGRVEVRGLSSFKVKDYESYNGRNPKTGEAVTVKPKKLPFFKAGRDLKNRVDLHSGKFT